MAVVRHGLRSASLNHLLCPRLQGACLLDGENLSVLFTLANTSQGQAYEYKGELRDIVQDYDGGNFSLFFANCEPLSAVSFDLQVRCYCSQSIHHHLLPAEWVGGNTASALSRVLTVVTACQPAYLLSLGHVWQHA